MTVEDATPVASVRPGSQARPASSSLSAALRASVGPSGAVSSRFSSARGGIRAPRRVLPDDVAGALHDARVRAGFSLLSLVSGLTAGEVTPYPQVP